MANRIGWREYVDFCRSLPDSDMELRIGQKFMNEKMPSVADPDLYYCNDADKCHRMIMDKYVNLDEE